MSFKDLLWRFKFKFWVVLVESVCVYVRIEFTEMTPPCYLFSAWSNSNQKFSWRSVTKKILGTKIKFWPKFWRSQVKIGLSKPLVEIWNRDLKTLVKFRNRALKTLVKNWKSGSETQIWSKIRPQNQNFGPISHQICTQLFSSDAPSR